MITKRDQLLNDLKTSVVEVFLYNGTSAKVTLQDRFFSQEKKLEQNQQLNEFHEAHADFVTALNVVTNRWLQFHINDIMYQQFIEN